jgi:glycosyltransferase involved in cell wall biosynthesis
MKSDLAIVIPYYKFTFFEETLLSLSIQTDKRFKVYIGDDASSENPMEVLKKYIGKIDFVYKRFESNLGGISLVKQWERCIEMVQGEDWIMILGDDDTIGDNCVAYFYRDLAEIEQQEINVIRYATVVIDQNDAELSVIHKHPQYEKSVDFLIRKFKGGTRSSLSEFLFKRKVLQEVGFKDIPLAWYSDLLAVLEVSKFGLIYTINDAVVCFRLSGINITSKTDDSLLKNKATFNFYCYLLQQHSDKLSKKLVTMIFERLEKTILDNKKNRIYWIKLFYFYGKFFQVKRFLLLFLKIRNSIRFSALNNVSFVKFRKN